MLPSPALTTWASRGTTLALTMCARTTADAGSGHRKSAISVARVCASRRQHWHGEGHELRRQRRDDRHVAYKRGEGLEETLAMAMASIQHGHAKSSPCGGIGATRSKKLPGGQTA